MRPYIHLFFILLLSFVFFSVAKTQETKKDSLLFVISNDIHSDKASLYHLLSKTVSQTDSILKYAKLSLFWAKQAHNKEQMGNAYKSIGVSYHLSNHYNSALIYYDSAISFFSKEKQADEIARTYTNKSGIFIRLRSLDSAIYYNELSKTYAELTNDNQLDRVYLTKKANIYSLQGKYRESIKVLKEAQKSNTLTNRLLIINLTDIGINYFDLGIIDSALYYYEKADAAGANKYPEDKISLLSDKANAYIFIGDHSKSISCYLNAIKIADSINYQYGISLLKSNLANLYYEWNEFEKAIKIYKQSMNYLKTHGIYNNLLVVYLNIGISYNSISEIDSSLVYLEKAKKICLQTNNQSFLASVYHNFGRCYFAKEEYPLSIQYYNKGLIANKINSNINTKANIYHDMALSYAELRNFDIAMKLADTAKTIYQKSHNTKQSSDITHSIAQIMAKANNYKEAYKQLNLYMLQKDSLFNTEKYKQINELETKYQSAQKEAQILKQNTVIAENKLEINMEKNKALTYGMLFTLAAILLLIIFIFLLRNKQKHQLEKTDLEHQQMELQGRLLRTQMNPHFIFNSLNSIQSYITSNDQYNAETYLSKFAKLMRSILENSRHSFISLEQDLSTLKIYLELEQLRFEGQFEYKIEIDEEIDIDNTYIPPMLIQPYIENAIIHGLIGKLEEKGLLTLKFNLDTESTIKCILEDNGIGREKAQELKARSIKPYKSLGMQVTKERMEMISEINKVYFEERFDDLKDEKGRALGTRVELIIPIEKD